MFQKIYPPFILEQLGNDISCLASNGSGEMDLVDL